MATLVALLPLVLLARLTRARAQDSVRDEVGLRLRVTTNMSASLLAEQMAFYVTLAEAEAEARRARLARAVAAGDQARFDRAEIHRELQALQAAREGIAATALLDLDGIPLDSPVAQRPPARAQGGGRRAHRAGRGPAGRAGRAGDVDLGGQPSLVVHRKVDPLGWTVFASLPHATAYAGLDAIRGTVLAISLALG